METVMEFPVADKSTADVLLVKETVSHGELLVQDVDNDPDAPVSAQALNHTGQHQLQTWTIRSRRTSCMHATTLMSKQIDNNQLPVQTAFASATHCDDV